MYGYGTVVYHFGRAGSARAMYTPAFSQAACHFGSNRRKSNGSVGRAGSAVRRAGDPRRGRGLADLTVFRRGRGFDRGGDERFRFAAARGARAVGFRPRRERDVFATRADRSVSRKAFPGVGCLESGGPTREILGSSICHTE